MLSINMSDVMNVITSIKTYLIAIGVILAAAIVRVHSGDRRYLHLREPDLYRSYEHDARSCQRQRHDR